MEQNIFCKCTNDLGHVSLYSWKLKPLGQYLPKIQRESSPGSFMVPPQNLSQVYEYLGYSWVSILWGKLESPLTFQYKHFIRKFIRTNFGSSYINFLGFLFFSFFWDFDITIEIFCQVCLWEFLFRYIFFVLVIFPVSPRIF